VAPQPEWAESREQAPVSAEPAPERVRVLVQAAVTLEQEA
jgi:hypothetical protein